VLQARFNLITADPDRMVDTVGYIKSEIRPAVESLRGSMGMSLYANTEVGVAVLESFWASRAALIASEQITAPRRKDTVQRAMGTVCVERYRVPVFEREAPLDTGAGLRLTRMDVEGSRVEDAVVRLWGHRRTVASGNCGFLRRAAASRLELGPFDQRDHLG
jgi:hypothetical protein